MMATFKTLQPLDALGGIIPTSRTSDLLHPCGAKVPKRLECLAILRSWHYSQSRSVKKKRWGAKKM